MEAARRTWAGSGGHHHQIRRLPSNNASNNGSWTVGEGSIRWGQSIPWRICAIPTPHGERIEGLGALPSPPARATVGGGREPVRPWVLFSETPNVGRMLLTTYHKQTRNIDPNISRWMLHGRRFATLNNLFRNIVKVFRNIPCASPLIDG
jgi:hypothetical protein